MPRSNNSNSRKRLGRYIVADPEICHGQPTFKGTRKMVYYVLESMTRGWTPEQTAEQWELPPEAIHEAIELAAKATQKLYSVPFPKKQAAAESVVGVSNSKTISSSRRQ